MEVEEQQTPAEAMEKGSEATALVESLGLRPKSIVEDVESTVRTLKAFCSVKVGVLVALKCPSIEIHC